MSRNATKTIADEKVVEDREIISNIAVLNVDYLLPLP